MSKFVTAVAAALAAGAILGGCGTGVFVSAPRANGTRPAVSQGTTKTKEPTGGLRQATGATGATGQQTAAAHCRFAVAASATARVNPAGVAFGNGCFVALQSGGNILTSRDKAHWTVANLGVQLHLEKMNLNLTGVAYGGGTFVAVGTESITNNGVRGVVFTSPDGADWTAHNPQITPPGGLPAAQAAENDSQLGAVSFSNGRFIAVGGDFSQGLILTSTDGGVAWTETLKGLGGDGGSLHSVAYGNGRYVALGNILVQNGVGGSAVLTSAGGSTWTAAPGWNQRTIVSGGVSYGAGHFTLTGVGGAVYTSTDGLDWTANQS